MTNINKDSIDSSKEEMADRIRKLEAIVLGSCEDLGALHNAFGFDPADPIDTDRMICWLSDMRAQQAAEAGQDVARYLWLKERFTGYDFYWGGDPMAEMDEDKGKCVIVFECGQDFRAGRDFEQGIDAAILRAAEADSQKENCNG